MNRIEHMPNAMPQAVNMGRAAVGAKRLGVRQSSGALACAQAAKAAGDCRSPRRFARGHPTAIFWSDAMPPRAATNDENGTGATPRHGARNSFRFGGLLGLMQDMGSAWQRRMVKRNEFRAPARPVSTARVIFRSEAMPQAAPEAMKTKSEPPHVGSYAFSGQDSRRRRIVFILSIPSCCQQSR